MSKYIKFEKYYLDSTHDALQTSFAFVLNSNEYKFIENQSVHKTSASNLGYVEVRYVVHVGNH